MLQCLHSFCRKCIEKKVDSESSTGKLNCPTCAVACDIPSSGVGSLPQDLRRCYEVEVAQYEEKMKTTSELNCDRCVEESENRAVCFCCQCSEVLCKACRDDHKRWRKTNKHELIEIGKQQEINTKLMDSIPHKPMVCGQHNDELLKYYCESCQTLVCRDCIMLRHLSHQHNLVVDVSEREKTNLLSSFADTESAKAELEEAIAQIEKTEQSVQAKQKQVDESISNRFKKLFEALQNREQQLLAMSSEVAFSKITALRIQSEELAKVRDEMDDTRQRVKSAAQLYTPTEMLSVKQTMKAKLQSLLLKSKACALPPCRSTVINASLDGSSVETAIEAFGDVSGGSVSSQGTASINIPRAIVSKERRLVVTARDNMGKQYPYGGENVSAKLALMGSDSSAIGAAVTDNDNGTYEVSLVPTDIGQHELSITIENQLIQGSPSVFHVREAREYISHQLTFSVSSNVYDVAVDDNKNVYIAVSGHHCISVFNESGTNIQTIGTAGAAGSGNGQFNSPSAIAINGDVIYVVDLNNHRIQKFDSTGKFISKFASRGSGDGQLRNPRGICLDQGGNVYVADQGNNRVCVFTGDGTFTHSILSNTSDGSELSAPWGLAIDLSGNLHIVTNALGCVKIFTTEGKYISTYGKEHLNSPSGIAIDEEGSCFIGDYYNCDSSHNCSRLVIFNSQYQHVKDITDFEQATAVRVIHSRFKQAFTNLNKATGVSLDKDGNVYIADYNNFSVKKYV